jgi:hypothetical protein
MHWGSLGSNCLQPRLLVRRKDRIDLGRTSLKDAGRKLKDELNRSYRVVFAERRRISRYYLCRLIGQDGSRRLEMPKCSRSHLSQNNVIARTNPRELQPSPGSACLAHLAFCGGPGCSRAAPATVVGDFHYHGRRNRPRVDADEFYAEPGPRFSARLCQTYRYREGGLPGQACEDTTSRVCRATDHR